jgi:hypothetical protein
VIDWLSIALGILAAGLFALVVALLAIAGARYADELDWLARWCRQAWVRVVDFVYGLISGYPD